VSHLFGQIEDFSFPCNECEQSFPCPPFFVQPMEKV
jgi:hypothetical protein